MRKKINIYTLPSILFVVLLFSIAGCRWKSPEQSSLSLHNALKDVTRMKVRTGGTCHNNLAEEKVLVEIDDPNEIADVVAHILIKDDASRGACGCCGNPTLEFYIKQKLTVSLSVHHKKSLRWLDGKWDGDGILTPESSAYLVGWLSKKGVEIPD